MCLERQLFFLHLAEECSRSFAHIFIILLCEARTPLGLAELFPFCVFLVMASPQRFLGSSLLQWNNMAAVASSVPWHVELMLRTRQASAVLLHISSGLQHNLTLQVSGHARPACLGWFNGSKRKTLPER